MKMDLSPILDIKASGFGRGSYPIEVGYVLRDGDSQCMLVRPAPGWNHWAPPIMLGLTRHRACADARLPQATFRRLRPKS